MEIEIQNVKHVVANIYAPNTDDVGFFQHTANMLDKFDNSNRIWGGDFNLVIDTQMDRLNSKYNNEKALAILKNIMKKFELNDVWRDLHPQQKVFTWSRANSRSHIDFFLVNAGLSNSVVSSQILHRTISDHDPVLIDINISHSPRGPGLWKLNTMHLKNTQFLDTIDTELKKVINETNGLGPSERWEAVKNHIRKHCIIKSKELAAARNIKLDGLYKDLQLFKDLGLRGAAV